MTCKTTVRSTSPDGDKEDLDLGELEQRQQEEIDQSDQPPEVWEEESRETSEVVIEDEDTGASITVERIDEMVMQRRSDGKRVRWIFDHPAIS